MTLVFEPIISTYVKPVSNNIHGSSIEFKASIGYERQINIPVFKVQMAINRKVKGRQAPTYEPKDWDNISQAKIQLEKELVNIDTRIRGLEIPYYSTISD